MKININGFGHLISCLQQGLLISYLQHVHRGSDLLPRKVVKQTWEGHLKGIVCYTEVDAVFCDFNNDTHSSTFDAAAAIIAHNDHIVKFTSLCGNDFSYIDKVTDIVGYMISKE